MPLSSNWMGINLKSPVILASITLFSKVRKNEHLEYYKKAVNYGAGAIVLPSVNPAYHNKSLENSPVIEVKMIDSGMGGKMGFSVLEPYQSESYIGGVWSRIGKRIIGDGGSTDFWERCQYRNSARVSRNCGQVGKYGNTRNRT